MKRLVWLLVIMCFTLKASENKSGEYINHLAPYPTITIFNALGKSQITYTNGDRENPEYLIITCDEVKQEMNVQYYITRDGFQITEANYFTIQRYPHGWFKMTPPYHAPSAVIYDAGMSGQMGYLIAALRRLANDEEWGIVITFETYVNDHDIITQAWSEVIPSYVFKRDLLNADLSICESTQFNSILPLVRHSNENP